MAKRKVEFANGEIYHIYNRGTDKRRIFSDTLDMGRFLQSMREFNTLDPIGSIYEHSFIINKHNSQLGSEASKLNQDDKIDESSNEPLVYIIAYCLNPNHYHFILEQVSDNGIEKFMQRLGTGYTKYFNNKDKRTGSLFQGVFKAVYVTSNEQLLHLSVYVNLNFRVHQYHESAFLRIRSSYDEYIGIISDESGMCVKDKVLGQFRNTREYQEFAGYTLPALLERKAILRNSLLE